MSEGLSDQLFQRFSAFLHERTGILLKEYKKYLVVGRLSSIVGPGKNYHTYEAFYEALSSERDGALLQKFINVLTTNFSYFFRDPVHFAVMEQYLRERAPSEPYLRFWSAASSTGEEAFSMAITLANHENKLTADRKILATDISTKVLGQAAAGIYPADAVSKYVSPDDLARYFDPVGDRYSVKASLRSAVDFRQLNLQESFPFQKQMDIVFLRNVMIYFGPEEKASVVEKVHSALKPGGLLFVGLSESLSGISHQFRSYKNSVFMKLRA